MALGPYGLEQHRDTQYPRIEARLEDRTVKINGHNTPALDVLKKVGSRSSPWLTPAAQTAWNERCRCTFKSDLPVLRPHHRAVSCHEHHGNHPFPVW
ncbi:hypothetical protein PG991_009271 [Apiospora marii]|uniref:Uncharacterized protein n=1 Tax=Apiospora marii TaxID=335849 RepID=A0ABR1RKI0_9PEZI